MCFWYLKLNQFKVLIISFQTVFQTSLQSLYCCKDKFWSHWRSKEHLYSSCHLSQTSQVFHHRKFTHSKLILNQGCLELFLQLRLYWRIDLSLTLSFQEFIELVQEFGAKTVDCIFLHSSLLDSADRDE